MQQAVFALSGDYGYINQIETTTKSIIYHHPGAKIYIINKNIPQEWFNNINNRIRPIKSQVINIKIDDNLLKNEHVSQPQINEMSYGRILIPDLLDDDRVLYLDSDIIVDQNLDELFSMDMGDHPIAAIPDLIYDGNFNSGVLLFNMPILKADPQIVNKMLKAGNDSTLQEGDQSVLNNFFDDSYLHLPLKYNLAIGYDFLCFYYPSYGHDYWRKTNIRGKIIHFTGPNKPWNQLSTSRYREKWWQYYDLSWREVCDQHSLPSVIDYAETGQCFTMTNSENLKNLEELAQTLPNWTFNVGAYTAMGGQLVKLARYSNIHLYESITAVLRDNLIQKANCYLDINYNIKDNDSLDLFCKTGKPIFSFDEVNSEFKNAINYHSFDNNDLDSMINSIRQLGK